jgi:Transposase DDE domain
MQLRKNSTNLYLRFYQPIKIFIYLMAFLSLYAISSVIKDQEQNSGVTGSTGYCAAKDEKYFGFKGHLLVTQYGTPVAYELAAANIDEHDILPEITQNRKGMILADKGLIRPELKDYLASQNLDLQTPLRKNMQDARPKETVSLMMNIRRKIETVIGQLVERFHIQSIKAKDLWHLCSKVTRKILAHSIAFMFNQIQNPDQPLALEFLLT